MSKLPSLFVIAAKRKTSGSSGAWTLWQQTWYQSLTANMISIMFMFLTYQKAASCTINRRSKNNVRPEIYGSLGDTSEKVHQAEGWHDMSYDNISVAMAYCIASSHRGCHALTVSQSLSQTPTWSTPGVKLGRCAWFIRQQSVHVVSPLFSFFFLFFCCHLSECLFSPLPPHPFNEQVEWKRG